MSACANGGCNSGQELIKLAAAAGSAQRCAGELAAKSVFAYRYDRCSSRGVAKAAVATFRCCWH
jgi:hypothetical protein